MIEVDDLRSISEEDMTAGHEKFEGDEHHFLD
jgi:hypothetical protein